MPTHLFIHASIYLLIHSSISPIHFQTHSSSVLRAPETQNFVFGESGLLISFMHLANIYPKSAMKPH